MLIFRFKAFPPKCNVRFTAHEIIWLSVQKKADAVYYDFPSNARTIAGSPLHFLLFEHFYCYFGNANPLGFSRKSLDLLVCVWTCSFDQRAMFWHVCVFASQPLPGWRKEGFFIWAMLVWTLRILTCLVGEEFCFEGQQGSRAHKWWEKGDTKQEI